MIQYAECSANEEVALVAEMRQMGLEASTLQAVQFLFPKERGLQFLALLCRYAMVKQSVLPQTGQADVAVLALPSIEDFARQHRWGKDTALRYMAILTALGILRHSRPHHQRAWHLRLSGWSPSSEIITSLDELIQTSRAKLRQFASNVKERLLLLYGTPTKGLLVDDVSTTLRDVQEQLAHAIGITKRRLLSQRLANLLLRLKQGDLLQHSSSIEVSLVPQQGDVPSRVQQETSLLTQLEGDFSPDIPPLTCNVRHLMTYEKRKNDNVQHAKKHLDEAQALSLAQCVEHERKNVDRYRQYLSVLDHRIVLAVYLYVLEEVHRRRLSRHPVHSPGGYFHRMCEMWGHFHHYEDACEVYTEALTDLQAQGKTLTKSTKLPGIPLDIQHLVERFDGWSYEDIQTELQLSSQSLHFSQPVFPSEMLFEAVPDSSCQWMTGQYLSDPRVPSRWMETEDEAQALIQQIQQDAQRIPEVRLEHLRTRPYRIRGTKQTVYVVDALVENIPEVYAAREHWEEYFSSQRDDL